MSIYLRNLIDHLLRLPELKDFKDSDFDSPQATVLQKEIFKKKKILRILYKEYSRPFLESAKRAPKNSKIVEIGSGVSPLKEAIPDLICTDLIHLPWLDVVSSAYSLPFRDHCLDRIFLMFVCHHLGKIENFIEEADRCLKPGGEMVIVDPAITLFSKFYYKYFHIDKMDITAKEWHFEGTGRLIDSNIALTWIVFFRDQERFKKLYPDFILIKQEYNTCLSFLLSGGFRIRQIFPTWLIGRLFKIENWIIRKISKELAVTMSLTFQKKED